MTRDEAKLRQELRAAQRRAEAAESEVRYLTALSGSHEMYRERYRLAYKSARERARVQSAYCTDAETSYDLLHNRFVRLATRTAQTQHREALDRLREMGD